MLSRHQADLHGGGHPVRYVIAATLAALLVTAAHAQRPTCRLQSIERKLAGPALTNFMKKCEQDMQVVCEKTADDRKLEGAARTIFTKRCVTTYLGGQ
jgi:hypothetical protein